MKFQETSRELTHPKECGLKMARTSLTVSSKLLDLLYLRLATAKE
jgi:hypothetical protein